MIESNGNLTGRKNNSNLGEEIICIYKAGFLNVGFLRGKVFKNHQITKKYVAVHFYL